MCTSSKQEIEVRRNYLYIFMCLYLGSTIREDYFKSSKLLPQWAKKWNRAHLIDQAHTETFNNTVYTALHTSTNTQLCCETD